MSSKNLNNLVKAREVKRVKNLSSSEKYKLMSDTQKMEYDLKKQDKYDKTYKNLLGKDYEKVLNGLESNVKGLNTTIKPSNIKNPNNKLINRDNSDTKTINSINNAKSNSNNNLENEAKSKTI